MSKIYVARKVSLIVIWTSFKNKMAVTSHVKWDYPIEKALSLIIATIGSKCEKDLSKHHPSY